MLDSHAGPLSAIHQMGPSTIQETIIKTLAYVAEHIDRDIFYPLSDHPPCLLYAKARLAWQEGFKQPCPLSHDGYHRAAWLFGYLFREGL